MREVGLLADGAIAIADGQIVAVGPSVELRARYAAVQELDATGKVVCPGFVDPHTHVVFAGDRINEFELRIQGKSYMEIMAAGGGIASTTRATRAAPLEQLIAETRPRLDAMWMLGTTTAEVKSGYGLDTATELKLLQTIAMLDQLHQIDLVPTFMGAHALPPEYTGRADEYVDLVVNEMIPAAAAWYHASHFVAQKTPLFADVFCEQNAFDVAQSRRVLEAARAAGMRIKAHVDEFTEMGGLAMALELGATSVDHLDATRAAGIARLATADAVGVVIPAVNFNLGSMHFADARAMIDAGAAIALSTDINPGSAPCPSMPLVLAIACRYQRLLPAEALTASTINAAYAIGMGAKIGSLEPGKQADVLIVNAPDYRHLAYQFGGNLVERVIKRGQVVRESMSNP
jgi:imidazolonepropionase